MRSPFIRQGSTLIRGASLLQINSVGGGGVHWTGITNMFVNIQVPVVTDSWTLKTLTQGRYIIDTIESGMQV